MLPCFDCTWKVQARKWTRTIKLWLRKSKLILGLMTRRSWKITIMFQSNLWRTLYHWRTCLICRRRKLLTMFIRCSIRSNRVRIKMLSNLFKFIGKKYGLNLADMKSFKWLMCLRRSYMRWQMERRDYFLWSMRQCLMKCVTPQTLSMPKFRSKGSSLPNSKIPYAPWKMTTQMKQEWILVKYFSAKALRSKFKWVRWNC